jgi:fructose-specific PTS system IIA-like component
MPLQFSFTCALPNGIHARPAGSLEEVARRFASSVVLHNARNGMVADAKSVLLLVGADVKLGDCCCVEIAGPDETHACTTLADFVTNEFPQCDEPLPPIPAATGEVVLPRSLRNVSLSFVPGTPVSRGIGRGRTVMVGALSLSAPPDNGPAADCGVEWRAVEDAVAWLRGTVEQEFDKAASSTEAAVLKAHLSIVRDPALSVELREAVFGGKCSAASAIVAAHDRFVRLLQSAESAYVRERVADVHDVCARLMARVSPSSVASNNIELREPSIVVAQDLSPSQFLALDRALVRGLVLEHGGVTSHTVILARAMGVPTLTGVTDAVPKIMSGQEVIVDADLGIMVTRIDPPVERYYRQESAVHARRRAKLASRAALPGRTADGVRLEVAANIALADEASTAFAQGAEGIGLFRTEMLFMERTSAPSENEQFVAYCRVVQAAGGRAVIIRTIDVGGDKPLPYLSLPAEDNPFLGFRAVRIYGRFPDIIRAQLRAILRASAYGPVKIMVPMVSCIEEVRFVKNLIYEIRAELDKERIPCDPAVELGIMVEIPAAAMAIEEFAQEVHFFSVGSNDLAQYFLAVDRENRAVSHLYSFVAPPFIRLLAKIVGDAHGHGKWVGLCGEMAADARNLPLLVGIGLDEISLGVPAIPEIKSALAGLRVGECRELVDSAMRCSSAAAVTKLLETFRPAGACAPLLDEELIIIDSSSSIKEEVIKQLVDALFIADRTHAPAAVEEAIWQREQVYATGLGYGFAIPHCKTDHVLANSIAVLKPSVPIQWGSMDGKPVEVVIMLAIRESDARNSHMKIFAKLARKIMHEEFREYLIAQKDPRAIQAFLETSLDMTPTGAT